MKTIKQRQVLALIITLLISSAVTCFAQPGPPNKMERFKEEKTKFFNEKLELSEQESKEFWPVYEDLHNRMMKINEDEKSLLEYYNSNAAAMKDAEIDETIAEYLKLQDLRNDLSKEYHNKYVEILGKRKTMQLYALERDFRRYILETFRKGRQGQGNGMGRNRNR